MNSTIEALQELYVTLGGEASDVENINTIPDMIEAINTVAGGGSGAEALIVTFTVNQSDNTVTCDTTLADIKNAIKNNQPVYAKSVKKSASGNPAYISDVWEVVFANTANSGNVIFETAYITPSLSQRWYINYTTGGLTAYAETITFNS